MKSLLLSSIATLVFSSPLPAQQTIHLGEFQTVKSSDATYDAFVPEDYNPAKRFPFLLIASDDARLIARFQPAASKYGYVVAQAATADAGSVWDDARRRFNVNASRSYLVLAGRNAAKLDFSELPNVAGLATINTVPRNLEAPTIFFSFGVLDTSYVELKQLSRMTSEQRRRVGSDTFDGATLDPAAATRIVEWLHLDALDQGIAVVTDDHVSGIVSNWTSTAQALEATDPLRAVSMYNAIVANFSFVTAQARSRSNQVASSIAYSRAEYAEGRAVRWEAAQKKKVLAGSRHSISAGAFFKSVDLKTIRARAEGKEGAMKNAAIRLLRYIAETAAEQESVSEGPRKLIWREIGDRVR